MSAAVVMEWRTCSRFPHLEISECGDLRVARSGPRLPKGWRYKGFIDADGYLRYAVKVDGETHQVTAYRLVAETFIGPPPSPQHQAAHTNGSRVSCHYRDLRWALCAENYDDTRAHETDRSGERNGRAKITEADVAYIRAEYRRVKAERVRGGLVALEKRFDLHRATVISIARGTSWRHVPMRVPQ